MTRLAAGFALFLFGCDSADETPAAAVDPPATPANDSASTPPAGDGPAELWVVGEVELPGDQKLAYKAHVERNEGAYSGTIDIPQQGATDLPLAKANADATGVTFSIANGATWTGSFDGDAVACSFAQSGTELPCTMKRVDATAFADAGPKRPQTPKPPFPYDVRDVEWDTAAGVHLAGTLSVPEGDGPHPAVIFVSGSGQQDRDETIFGHKPFAVMADRLARAGVASLRYDDREIGGSKGDIEKFTMLDEADDASSALDQVLGTESIDKARVGIVGHSIGGIIAPLVASRRPDDVAFAVLLAGTGVTGKQLHARQVEDVMKAQSLPAAAIEAAKAQNAKIFAVLDAGGTRAEMRKEIVGMLEGLGMPAPAAEAQADSVSSPWFRTFLSHDPIPALEATACPVLIVTGELDLQVAPDQNVPAIEAALSKGNNADVTTLRFDGLNHLLQPAKTGTPEEYASIETTIDEKALAAIEAWIVKKTSA